VAIALVDLDHFKAVNDDFGHQAGDATLRGVARALRSELRDADHVGRLGGEEFLAILPDTGPQEAVAVAERIRERIAAMPRKVDRAVTASVGVAAMPGDATGVDQLMGAADRALYAAKDGGRDRVVWSGALEQQRDDGRRRAAVPA
jgi:diguanylate cyclase (GGDEF)-like protein